MSALFDDADLITAGVGGLGGAFSIGEKRRLPMIQAYMFPLTPTHAYASPLLSRSLSIGLLNRLSFHVMRQMLWMTTNATDAETRRSLGLPSASILGPFGALKRRRVPVLYGYSRHVLPRPDDWDERTQVTGYWFLDPPSEWQPPADLTAFLQAGSPPIYIGFGSMGSEKPEQTTALLLDALVRTGQRALLVSGWGGLSRVELPSNVYMLTSVPHTWLFPRMAAVVHHGGAGTTAAGLRAGVPSLIVPHFGDQAFWGQRVAERGVGPAPIPRRRLTAERLAEAIERMITDTAMRQRAAELGVHIRAEGGIGRAVELIERWAAQS
jgi:sterol 3beta-glucosyltransferase